MLRQLDGLYRLVHKRYDGMIDLYRRYGTVVALGPYVYLFGPEANRFVFANPQLFRWGKAFDFLKPVVGDTSLIVSDGDDHKRRRGLVQPAFHHRQVNGYLEVLAAEADRHIGGWSDGRKVDLYREFRRAFRDMNVRSVFGERIGERAGSFGDLLEPMLEMINRMPQTVEVHRRLRSGAWRRAMAGKRASDELIMAEIARLRAGDGDDRVLAALVRGRDDDGSGLTDIEVRDQVFGLISAAFETTSAAMSWIVHILHTNRGTWARAREEVAAVLGDRPPSADDLPKLVYLNGVVQEALRLRPPAPVSVRVPVEDFTFDGHTIKAGRMTFYSPYVTHRLAEVWPEPERFLPERWDRSNAAYRKPGPHEFLPFGGGPHRCVGSSLATTGLTVMLARLLAQVEIDLEPGPVIPHGYTTMRPRDGLPARVTSSTLLMS